MGVLFQTKVKSFCCFQKCQESSWKREWF